MTDPAFYTATAVSLIINLLYAIVALLLSVSAFNYIDKRFFREIDFIDEIKKGNIAASIFASTLLCFIAAVVGMALRS